MRRTIWLSVLWMATVGVAGSGCGGVQPSEGGATGGDLDAPDASSGASAMSERPPIDLAEDDGSFQYPCDYPAKQLDAVVLGGPFASIKAMCKSHRLAGCAEVGPTISYPGGAAMFDAARVIHGQSADGEETRIAIQRAGKWYASESIGAPDERPQHDGPLITESGELFGERLMVNLTFSRGAGAADDGSETMFRRSVTVLCAAGESGVPSCAVVPGSWEREQVDTEGQPVGESTVTQLRYLSCDDGTIVVYGNLERLSGDTAVAIREFIGRRRLKFP